MRTNTTNIQQTLLEFTMSEMSLFELNMRNNGLDCKHFSPSSIRFENERTVIEIDSTGLSALILPYKDEERTIDGDWEYSRQCEPVDSILDALELLDIDRTLINVVYEMEVTNE